MAYTTLADARAACAELNRRRQSIATRHQPKSGRYYVTYETNGTYTIRFTYLKRQQCMEIN